MRKGRSRAKKQLELKLNNLKEQLKTTPNPNASELLNRWDMQQTPPDILITNYSMLNVMMMRSEEDGLFEKTRQWLKEDKGNVFHLIVDELHLNRGTAGAEVSWLLQLYLHRIGLKPGDKQLKILASSASLEDANEYVENFFNFEKGSFEDHFKVISEMPEEIARPENLIITESNLLELYEIITRNNNENPDEIIERIFDFTLDEFLNLVKDEISYKISHGYKRGDLLEHNLSFQELSSRLFPDNVYKEESTKALFYLRSLFDSRPDGRDLPS